VNGSAISIPDWAPPTKGAALGRLRDRDFRLLLDVLAEVAIIRTLDDYGRLVLQAVQRLVPGEYASFNEVDLAQQRVRFAIFPRAAMGEIERLAHTVLPYLSTHPMIVGRHGSPKHATGWLRITDVVTKREFHRSALYNEYFRRVGTEAQIGLKFPSSRGRDIILLAINRASGDFADRERLALDLLWPHLQRAYEQAEMFDRIRSQVALFMAGTATARVGVAIVIESRIAALNEAAGRWLREYFGVLDALGQLPRELEHWLVAHDGKVAIATRQVAKRGSDAQLTVRAVHQEGGTILLLEEYSPASSTAALASLGLTRREGEVLRWAADGKTNIDIGKILGLSHRTVQHHLDAIYRKLGVETRTAAAARLFEAQASL
jgi:DNA-binding CsgD family transcriptional regulator